MAALVCPATGVVVDASKESYETLLRAGYKPVQAESGPQIANDKPAESPRKRTRKPAAHQ